MAIEAEATPAPVSATLRARSTDIQGDGNFLQGCSFSPDGLCVLTSTVRDSRLRLYNTPTVESGNNTSVQAWETILSSKGGDTVRSYSWYPPMNSSIPLTCCFLAATRDQPVHLYDAYSGAVRATYRSFNALDEIESPTVVQFSDDGQRILCGGYRTDRTIHVFDTAIPGRQSTIMRLGKTRRSSDGQKGLVSAACYGGKENNQVFAIGTYSPGSIYIYDHRTGEQTSGTILSGLCLVGHGKGHSKKKRRFPLVDNSESGVQKEGDDKEENNWMSAAKIKWFHSRAQGGVTQLMFSPQNEYILYSASRRSNAIISWDLRMLSGDPKFQSKAVQGLASYECECKTNQRIEFDVDPEGRTLFVGGQDNCVKIYDIVSGKLLNRIDGLGGVANGVSHANVGGKSLLAVATGSRKFASPEDSDCEDSAKAVGTAPGYMHLYELSVDDS